MLFTENKRGDNMNKKLLQLADKTYSGDKIKIEFNDNQEFIIGWLIMNRCNTIAYKNLDLSSLHRDSLKCLNVLKKNDEEQAKIFQKSLALLSTTLKDVDFNYAFLKGATLSSILYDIGERTSKDFDILVESNDVSALQRVLIADGFKQGWLDSDYQTIIPATRREIVESRMNFGQSVPFIKIYDEIPVTVDINFSVDFKPDEGEGVVHKLLKNVEIIKKDEFQFKSLAKVDFLIHLCCHLYKEATTFDWVSERRDLDMYKFSDINVYLKKFGNHSFFKKLVEYIKSYEVEKECYYTFKNSSLIFPTISEIEGFNECIEKIKPKDISFMNEVIYPREKKSFYYRVDFLEWLMSNNRISLLNEKKNND